MTAALRHNLLRDRLSAPWLKATVLLVVVLALHWLALGWFADQMPDTHMTPTSLPEPLFMRVLPKPATTALAPTAAQPRRSASRLMRAPETVQAPAPLPALLPATTAPELPQLQTLSPQAPDPAWPPNTRLTYHLKGYYRGEVTGTGQVLWQHTPEGQYEARIDLRVALFLTASMRSQGVLSDAGLLPQRYEEQVMGNVRRLLFDGIAVTFHDGNALRQPALVQDTASQFVELTRRFSSGRAALEVGAEVPLWLARPLHMDRWTYDVVGLDTLELAELGAVQAYHLQPRPVANPHGNITAEMWFAPALQYLPVRIRINLGEGNYVDLLVERIEQG